MCAYMGVYAPNVKRGTQARARSDSTRGFSGTRSTFPCLPIGVLVVSMIVNHAAKMYSTTLFVRAFIIASLLVLFGIYRDPALLAISAVVIIGWVLTFIGWRRDSAAAR